MKRILLVLFVFPMFLSAQITLNEVVYDPNGPDGGANPGEWIELYCNGGSDCDISCYVVTDGDWTVTIPDGTTVVAGDFYVIGNASFANTPNPVGGSTNVDLDVAICGCTSGSSVMVMTNTGEFVSIFDDMAGFVEGVVFETPSASGNNQPENAGTISSAAITGCSEQTLDIALNAGNFINVGEGNENGIAKDIDGVGTWEYIDGINTTPGSTNAIPAPVSLTTFTAKPMATETVTLNWATASEENNEYFSIEHSVDGRSFTAIDRVLGVGTTTEMQQYEFMHRNPGQGNNYYRLRQVDFDGTFSFSPTAVVELKSYNEINVQPTLAHQNIELSIAERLNFNGAVEVFNTMGQLVKTAVFPAQSSTISINVGDLQSGHYMLRINTENGIIASRFVKL